LIGSEGKPAHPVVVDDAGDSIASGNGGIGIGGQGGFPGHRIRFADAEQDFISFLQVQPGGKVGVDDNPSFFDPGQFPIRPSHPLEAVVHSQNMNIAGPPTSSVQDGDSLCFQDGRRLCIELFRQLVRQFRPKEPIPCRQGESGASQTVIHDLFQAESHGIADDERSHQNGR